MRFMEWLSEPRLVSGGAVCSHQVEFMGRINVGSDQEDCGVHYDSAYCYFASDQCTNFMVYDVWSSLQAVSLEK